jgi:hypothetical protein
MLSLLAGSMTCLNRDKKQHVANLSGQVMMEPENSASTSSARARTAEVEDMDLEQEPPKFKARYEQSFPKRRQGGNEGVDHSETVYTSTMDRTHDATTVNDAAESTYSYDSTRDWALFFKEIDGRMFNNQSTPYILPAGQYSSCL